MPYRPYETSAAPSQRRIRALGASLPIPTGVVPDTLQTPLLRVAVYGSYRAILSGLNSLCHGASIYEDCHAAFAAATAAGAVVTVGNFVNTNGEAAATSNAAIKQMKPRRRAVMGILRCS